MHVFFALILAAAADALPGLEPAASESTRFYVVRHGQANLNLSPRPRVPPAKMDDLTDLGRKQSEAVARALTDAKIALIVTSPAGRARHSARVIRSGLGRVPVRVDRQLRPTDLGRSAAGRPLTYEDRIKEWQAGRDPAPRGGESLEQTGARMLAAVKRVAPRQRGRGIVIVSHSEAIGALLDAIGGTPPHQRYPQAVRNGSISVVDVVRGSSAEIRLSDHVPEEVAAPAR